MWAINSCPCDLRSVLHMANLRASAIFKLQQSRELCCQFGRVSAESLCPSHGATHSIDRWGKMMTDFRNMAKEFGAFEHDCCSASTLRCNASYRPTFVTSNHSVSCVWRHRINSGVWSIDSHLNAVSYFVLTASLGNFNRAYECVFIDF